MGEVREDLEERLRTPLNTDHRCSCGDGDGYDRCLYCEALMRNERERTEAADELARLRAEVAQLREERDRYRATLEEITLMPNELLLSDAATSDQMADRAYAALTPTGADRDA